MRYPLWAYWQFYVVLILTVYAVCRAINPRFLVRRVVFGTLALVFDAFTAWVVMAAFEPQGCVYMPPWFGCLFALPFALIGYLFTWRFAIWHQKAVSIRTLLK